jgi:methylthioribose-1-phosphate isomerase
MDQNFYTLKWNDKGNVSFIDQRVLPNEEKYITCNTYLQVADAIKTMVVRGAPAIGVSAAYGISLGLIKDEAKDLENLDKNFNKICSIMSKTRPTAVNLFWAIDKMKNKFNELKMKNVDIKEIKNEILNLSHEIYKDDIKINKNIGQYGAKILKGKKNILTHCNAGALATVAFGTALSVIRYLNKEQKVHVYCDETRPFLQGSRLTVWELMKDGIDCTLISDNMSAHIMSKGKIDAIVVGADRVAKNGDSANKIGTYALSILAKHHSVPMYFAVPTSTIDINCENGSKIPIEERNHDEVRLVNGNYICPKNTKVENPSFDVTPNDLITGIITEKGVLYPPFSDSIEKLF